MPVPEIIPIAHEPDYRTSTIGRFDGGQFFASITYASPESEERDDAREGRKQLYAVLHKFNPEGSHTDSDIWCAGTWDQQQRHRYDEHSPLNLAERKLEGMLAGLPGREYGSIAIRPFQLTVDGVVFGLVTECHGEDEDGEHDWAELYPDGLGFGDPWDGECST